LDGWWEINMAGETFGAPAGISQAIGDMNQLSQMSARNFGVAREQQLLPGELALQQGQIAQQPVDMFGKAMLGALRKAQAQKAEQDYRLQRSLGEAISKMASDPNAPKDMADFTSRIAEIAAKVEDPNSAIEWAGKAVVMQGHKAKLKEIETQSMHAEHLAKLDAFDYAARAMNFAQNQEDLDTVNKTIHERWPQQGKLPWEGRPFTPALKQQIIDSSMSSAKNADLDYKEAVQKLREQQFDDKKRHESLLEDIRKKLADITEEREKRLEKNGGKVVGNPSKAGLESVNRLIKKDYPNAPLDDPTVQDFANSIESAVMTATNNNHSLDPVTTRNKIYLDRQDQLRITDVENKWYEGKKPPKAEFKPRLGTFEEPVPLPAKEGDWLKGEVYRAPNGKPAKYLGDGRWEVK
jgi:hypothetical protein